MLCHWTPPSSDFQKSERCWALDRGAANLTSYTRGVGIPGTGESEVEDMRKSWAAGVVAALVVLAPAVAASADTTPTTVSGLTATASGTVLNVTGAASFADADTL